MDTKLKRYLLGTRKDLLSSLGPSHLERYHQWHEDPTADLFTYMDGTPGDGSSSLIQLCDSIQEIDELLWELRELERYASIGAEFRELIRRNSTGLEILDAIAVIENVQAHAKGK